jgi:predicted MFS family arabinose efflux permease
MDQLAVTAIRAKNATKIIFLVCGLGISSWAPMVPYAKDRLQLNDSNLGLLLLMLGLGAIAMMPVSGILAHRYGTRKVILVAAIVMALMLPMLLMMPSVVAMGLVLFIFGSAVGTVDVAMNSQGVQVERTSPQPIMSSLHGLFSVGGLFGSLGLGFLMKLGLEPVHAAIAIAVLLIGIVSWKYGDLLNLETERSVVEERPDPAAKKSLMWLNNSVLFLGVLCFAVFLSEGAMLDWSAIFLKENRGIDEAFAGIGYAAFSVAMASMRLVGDKLVARFDGKTVVITGCILAAAGLSLAVFTPWLSTSIGGFILLGLGTANIVPVFISEGGKIRNVPATVSIPAISTIGYAGQLAGPAILGFIAHQFSLSIALAFNAALLLLVALAYSTRKNKSV